MHNQQQSSTDYKLRVGEDFYRKIVESHPDFINRYLPGGIITYVNPALAQFAGVDVEMLIGKSFYPFIHEDDREETIRQIESISRDNPIVVSENKTVLPNGSIRWNQWTQTGIFDEKGDLVEYQSVGIDITERKLAETALRERENRFRSIFNFSPVAIGLGEVLGGRMVEVNDAWLRLFGYERDEVIGRTVEELSLYADSEERNRVIAIIKGQGRVLNFPVQLRNKKGSIIDIQYSAEIITLDSKPYLQVIMTDITELKLAEHALKKSEYFFKESQRSASIGSYFADFVSGQWESSDVLDSIFGIGKDYNRSIQGWLDIVHPDDRDYMGRYLTEEVISNKKPFSMEYRIIRRNDGETRWVNGRGTVRLGSDGNTQSLIGTIQDITDRKQLEIALTKSEQSLRTIIKVSPVPLAINDSHEKVTFVNDAFLQTIGYTLDEIPTLEEWWHRAYPDPQYRKTVADNWMNNLEEARRTSSPFIPVEANIVCKDDAIRTFICSAASIESGFEGNYLVVLFDITARKKAEDDLKKSEANLSATLDATADGILAVDGNGKVIFYNKKFFDLWNIPPSLQSTIDDETLLSYVLTKLLDPDAFVAEVKRLYNSHESSFDLINFKDGRIFERYSFSLYQSNAPLTGRVWSFRDITDRKKAEEEKQLFEQQMQHTQKLESLGVLSGGIAHDFNNILAIIMGYCALTKMDYETAEQNIQEIEKAAERAAALCRQMLAYAGKAQLTKSQVNMWTMVDEMVTMLKSTLPQNTVIKPDLSTNIPIIEGDASQLRQIVMNLIINSSEAIGTEQGEIDVSLTKKVLNAGHPEKDYHGKEISPGRYVCLEVTDNGCGMDEETKWRIFEPFYTTKFTGRGLGMSSVLGIINSHGGALQLFSQPGQGTTFKVYLPVLKGDSCGENDKNQSIQDVPWQGSGTVLLVEDEDQIRFLAKSLLTKFGFTVLEAVNDKEALELYQKNRAEIRLVFTDMGMPVMDGYALFPALKQLNPKLPIIISSGFGDADVASRIGHDNIAGMINKPYNPSQLCEVLKSVVDSTYE